MTDLKPMNKTVSDALASLLRTVEEKKQRQTQEESITTMAKKNLPVVDEKIMLPEWPDDKRAIPNSFVRSALFGIVKKGDRQYLQKSPIMTLKNLEIKYTGQQLDQTDQDVWLAIVQAMNDLPLGEIATLTSYDLLKTMGLSLGKENYIRLENSITRMVANAVHVKTPEYTYIGSLFMDGFKNEDNQKWTIQLNPKLLDLFQKDNFTHLDFQTRKDLKGQLAKWLHSFYSSHAKPLPYKIETLKELCGSETKELFTFKQQIKKALDEIVEVSKKHHQIVRYEIVNGLVHFEKISAANLLKKVL